MEPTTFAILYTTGTLLGFAVCWIISNQYGDYLENELHISRRDWLLRSVLLSLFVWEILLAVALCGALVELANNGE